MKRSMIQWWGPILFEYSEHRSDRRHRHHLRGWLRKPGSVGTPILGGPYITDDEGDELPAGEVGTVWFAGASDLRLPR